MHSGCSRSRTSSTSSFVVVAFALFWSRGSLAQSAPAAPTSPAETVKAQPATTGKTDIAKGGFVTAVAAKEDDPKTVNDVSIGLGGLFSAGNARTVALTTLGRARVRRDEHQFSTALTANFARAGKKGESIDT